MSNHTPGPWKVVPALSSPGRFCVITESDGISITGWGSVTQADSDAKLIAAAPDLLEALQELVDLVDEIRSGNYSPDSFTTQPAMAAIKKATQ